MAIKFSNLFGTGTKRSKGRPIINEIPLGSNNNSSLVGSSVLTKKQQFWNWFKSRPELNSPVSARVDDTIVDVDFFKPDGSPLGRNKQIEAQEFWDDNFMNERLKSIWFDAMITGSGFGLKGSVDLKKLREVTNNMAKNISVRELEGCSQEISTKLFLRAIDEDIRKTRSFDYVASSTMVIQHDMYDITGYTQNFGGITEDFTPSEIIHFAFSRLDGKVDGWTPVESLSSELILIWFIKQNMLSYCQNGGTPKKVFTLPEELADSDNHKFMVQLLEQYGAVENRHGNLVLTGKVDIVDLEEKLKDMEYKELALYVTSNVAYALRVPVSRIPYMIGQSQSNGDAGGLAESGYWSMIESDQKRIEQLLNTQMLKGLGFIVRFKKRYKVDDLREANAMTIRADAISKMNSILVNYGQELSKTKVAALMDLKLNDIVPRSNPMEPLVQNNLMNQSILANNALENPDKKKKNDTKSDAAVNNPKNVNQTGV